MKLENKKKLTNSSLIIVIIFFLDRISKLYVLSLANINSSVDIFVTKYLNIYLIWNEGIAYGLLSFGQSSIYNIITALVVIISLVVYVLIIKTNDIRFYFFSFSKDLLKINSTKIRHITPIVINISATLNINQ